MPAPRDDNRVPAIQGTSNVDDVTPVNLAADPVTKRLLVQADIDMATEGMATEATLQVISGKLDSAPGTNFAFYGSTSDATYDYVGKQAADGKWYILRIHKVDGTATYAVGDSDMATAWAAFATQDYDVYANHHPS